GLRIGSGPRGNYVHLGRAGVYYRHTFSSDAVPAPRCAPPPVPKATPDSSLHEIESGAAAAIVDSSSEDLLNEIRTRRRKLALRPFAVTGAVLLLFMVLNAGWPGWALLLAAAIAVGLVLGAGYRDRIAKTVVIL